MKIMSALQLKYRREYFHETLYKYEPSSDDVQRIRTVTPPHFFWNYAPLKFFL